MTSKQYTIRIFLWSVAVQLVFLYVDIYNGMPILDDDAKYVIHVLSRYLTPVAIGVGIFLYIIEYAGAIIARKKMNAADPGVALHAAMSAAFISFPNQSENARMERFLVCWP